MSTEAAVTEKLSTTEAEAPTPETNPGRARLIRLALGAVIAIVVIWGVYAFARSFFYESTDDAFVECHVVTISSKLSNLVSLVKIDDNTEVHKGDLLVQIDPRDYEVQLQVAEANFKKAQSDYDRDLNLTNTKAISVQDLDTTKAALDVAAANLKQAQLNLEYTRIVAPVDGRITRKAVEPGSYVSTGETLFSIVPHDVWVIANFKETQLTHMQVGQLATIEVDAFPGRTFKAQVQSLQAGTGARFSLLPAENATGNYVKVVQRVPVKIIFDEPDNVKDLLSPGLSVMAEVKVR